MSLTEELTLVRGRRPAPSNPSIFTRSPYLSSQERSWQAYLEPLRKRPVTLDFYYRDRPSRFTPEGTLVTVDIDWRRGDRTVIQLTELTRLADMVTNHRPTTSRGQALETGGSFSLEADRRNQERLNAVRLRMLNRFNNSATSARGMLLYRGEGGGPAFDWSPIADADTEQLLNKGLTGYEVQVRQPGWFNVDRPAMEAYNAKGYLQLPATDDPALTRYAQVTNLYLVQRQPASVQAILPVYDGRANQYTLPYLPEAFVVGILHLDGAYYFGCQQMPALTGRLRPNQYLRLEQPLFAGGPVDPEGIAEELAWRIG